VRPVEQRRKALAAPLSPAHVSRASADEQLKQRDLSRSDPELVKRFGKGTHYDLKACSLQPRPPPLLTPAGRL